MSRPARSDPQPTSRKRWPGCSPCSRRKAICFSPISSQWPPTNVRCLPVCGLKAYFWYSGSRRPLASSRISISVGTGVLLEWISWASPVKQTCGRSRQVRSSSATHSTWWVIGKRSKARSPRQPVAVLGEGRQVARQRGGVAGDVRDGARRAVDHLLHDLAAGALAGRVQDDEVERLVVRRREHAVHGAGGRPRHARGDGGWSGRARRRCGRPRPPPPGRTPPPRRRGTRRRARPRRRGRGPSPPAGGPASRPRCPPGRGARPGGPARSRRPRPRSRAPRARSRRSRGPGPRPGRPAVVSIASGRAIRHSSIGMTSRERCRRMPRLPSRATAYSIRVRQCRPWSSPGTASTSTSTSSSASRASCSRTTAALSARCAGRETCWKSQPPHRPGPA